MENKLGIVIEGVIGVEEQWQFEKPNGRISTIKTLQDFIGEMSPMVTEVDITLNVTGGSFEEAILMYEYLRSLKRKITVNIFGFTPTVGLIIAQAATNGCRRSSTNALISLNRCESACDGNAEQMRLCMDKLIKIDEIVINILSGNNDVDIQILANALASGNAWLTPQDVLELGMIDEIF